MLVWIVNSFEARVEKDRLEKRTLITGTAFITTL
jgi:hypothetical protein